MKKIILGLVIGMIVTLPVGAFAWGYNQIATPTFVAGCDNGDPNNCYVEVSRYREGNIICNVAYVNVNYTSTTGQPPAPSISCIKAK